MNYKIQFDYTETIENGEEKFDLFRSDTMFVRQAPLIEAQVKYIKKFLKKQNVTASLIQYSDTEIANLFRFKSEVNATVTKTLWDKERNRFSENGKVMRIEDAVEDVNKVLTSVEKKKEAAAEVKAKEAAVLPEDKSMGENN